MTTSKKEEEVLEKINKKWKTTSKKIKNGRRPKEKCKTTLIF
jgi:hypothetical protein